MDRYWNAVIARGGEYEIGALVELSNPTTPRLTVVVPVFNEAESIESTLSEFAARLADLGVPTEMIVVDDGSTDGSAQILEQLPLKFENLVVVSSEANRGKGNALRLGFARSRGEWVGIIDSDGELSIEQLVGFLRRAKSEEPTVFIGSKRVPGAAVDYPSERIFLSRAFHKLVELMFSIGVSDSQVGLKLMPGSDARWIASVSVIDRFAFDVELLLLEKMRGRHIVELPVDLRFGRKGLGRVKLGTLLGMVRELIGLWARVRLQSYYLGRTPARHPEVTLSRQD